MKSYPLQYRYLLNNLVFTTKWSSIHLKWITWTSFMTSAAYKYT